MIPIPSLNEMGIDLEAQAGKEIPEEKRSPSSATLSSPTSTTPLVKSHYSRRAFCKFRAAILSVGGSLSSSGFLGQNWRKKKHYHKVIVRRLKDCHKGYPNVAAFLDSDDNFMVYRRFGYVQSRLLLESQYNLRQLEQELEELDEEDNAEAPKRLKTRDYGGEPATRRTELFAKIQKSFCEYSNLLLSAQQMSALNRPSTADYQSVRNYFFNHKPLLEEDEEWIKRREDLVTLKAGREHAWLDDAIEHSLRRFGCKWINNLFRSKVRDSLRMVVSDVLTRQETRMKTDDKDEVYYTRPRIERLVVSIITFMILILLVVPIYVLYHLLSNAGRVMDGRTTALCIGVLIVFTLAFSAVLSLFTRAKRHEILAAAAAYCAVLVVFLGNVGPGSY